MSTRYSTLLAVTEEDGGAADSEPPGGGGDKGGDGDGAGGVFAVLPNVGLTCYMNTKSS